MSRLFVGIGLLVPGALGAQSQVRGRVTDTTGAAIPGVEIAVTPWGRSFRSGAEGAFRIDSIPDGRQRVLFRLVGYRAQQFERTFEADTLEVDVVLAPGLVTLPPVIIAVERIRSASVAMETFRRRRAAAVGGAFLDGAALRASDHAGLATVLRRLAGLAIVGLPNRSGRAVSTSRNRRCYAQIYRDGLRIWGMRDLPFIGPFNIDLVEVSELEALEFYRSSAQTPAELVRSDAPCGTLVLWSRERRDSTPP